MIVTELQIIGLVSYIGITIYIVVDIFPEL